MSAPKRHLLGPLDPDDKAAVRAAARKLAKALIADAKRRKEEEGGNGKAET